MDANLLSGPSKTDLDKGVANSLKTLTTHAYICYKLTNATTE